MDPQAETLHIQPIRPTTSLPMADVARTEPNHPQAAAIARARIATISDGPEHIIESEMAAVPTSQLVTQKAVLATQIMSEPAGIRRPQIPTALQPLLTAAGIFLVMLLLFKAPIVISQLSYLLNKPKTPVAAVDSAQIIPTTPTITIPKINVSAPVVYEPSVAEANVLTALQGGVDHYGNTPPPGQTGNAVFFGHSSNDWWEPGNYKFVFVLLNKLAPGDQFNIDYQGVRYTYQVTGSRVVQPNDLSPLIQTTTPTVTLITCTPPGTSWQRLIVSANQISPDPTKTKKPATAKAGNPQDLPGSATSFWDQIKQVFSGIGSLFGAGGKNTPTINPQSQPAQLPNAN